ncbi:LamG-like jellyroll fold domain-containing protein [Fimbriimonas ginsengisoli]|uniref:Uncharacterized protein n=1 Tax=Fimbriimonas ginsengisoli Gsoil 348 TaxID=661478 RepID=A0A068NNX6_FIMGI|nr:LamG-like jellyroll fold domain-containing protein [Fimbriimonas ginsengisoli]AIE85136.1 hypothetical protein OP10G_1768 [Fimbriimonas ginsengisoli Gsoil 348]
MTKLFLLIAAVAAQTGTPTSVKVPLKIDGTTLAKSDYVATGNVSARADAIVLDGGHIELSAARQKSFDSQLTKPTSLILTLADLSTSNTGAMTLGQLHLMRTDNIWFLVNQSDGQWRQTEIGQVTDAAPLKLAFVFDGKKADLYRDGKPVGSTPYEPKGAQKLVLGSTADDKGPWKGEIREFEILTKGLKPEEVALRANPKPVQPSSETPTSAQAETKSTTVEAELVGVTAVPAPDTIKPYVDALIVDEYKVVSVTSGHIRNADAGKSIRVAHWGIVAGKKTAVADYAKGDKRTLILEKFADHPAVEHQYTINDLPDDFAMPYLLDVTTKRAGK